MNSSKLSQFCDRALEAGWLLGVIITPVFFNVYSDRVFEPDKLTTLRSLAVVMAALWLVRLIDEALHGGHPLRFSWRTPMVWPALATMLIYLISSVFSLVPYTSFVGSYQRLQGTFTLFGYLVLFFAVLTSLRTRMQLSRLITALIFSSLPVALYGIVQHNGLDPLPWAGNVQTRVASNMGNAIFVAAYLLMIAPLVLVRIVESFQDILRRPQARMSDILRASAYIFTLVVQLLTIWYSRSRGPWLGIAVAMFFFPYLALIVLQKKALADAAKTATPWRLDVLKGVGMGLGTLLLAVLLVGLGVLIGPGSLGVYVGGGMAALSFGGIWLYFVVERKGWRWLWLGWITIGLVGATGLLAVNLPGPLKERVGAISSLQRMTTILEWDSGTGRVRTLIWEGAMELIAVHDPIVFPDGSTDKFNVLRPLIGYGPESMYVAYNSFYPPELGHYESRTASPDRSHNETLDAVVITGVLGLLVYLFVFGSVAYWILRWLGLLNDWRDLLVGAGLVAVIALALFLYLNRLGGAYFFALAIPLGFVAGLVLYLTWSAFRMLLPKAQMAGQGEIHPHALLLVGLLAAFLGHFVEINFGIAIASTRTVFWAMAGMMVVLGLQWAPGEASSGVGAMPVIDPLESVNPATVRRRRPKKDAPQHPPTPKLAPWWPAVLTLSLVAMFLLSTLAFDFITNTDRLTSSGEIFWRALTTLAVQQKTSYGTLMIFVFTWALLGLVGLSELDREGVFGVERRAHWWQACGLYTLVTLFGFLLFGSLLAGKHALLPQIQVATIEDIIDVAMRLAGVLLHYYWLIFLSMAAIAWSAMREDPPVARNGEWAAWLTLPFVLGIALLIIYTYSYNLICADIVFKQGKSFANMSEATQKQVGIAHYEKALELVPHEDYYYLFLGKAYLELGQVLGADVTAQQREGVYLKTEEVLTTARAINPLNTDHSANLARFYRSWAAQQSDLARRSTLLQSAEDNYYQALTLSPNNPILWNELAILSAFDMQDEVQFRAVISQSLALDDRFEQTWMVYGDVQRDLLQDIPGAIESYQRALELSPGNCTVRYVLGTLLLQQEAWRDLTTFLQPMLTDCATMQELWDVYRMLAIAHFYQGDSVTALQWASQALSLTPEAQRPLIQQLIDYIQQSPVEP